MKTERLMVRLLVICCALFFCASTASMASSLKVLSSFPVTHLYTTGGYGIFAKNLEEISGGKFNLNLFGPDVVPPAEQFQPTQSGVFDMLFTHAAYHLGTTAVGTVMEAFEADPSKRRSSGVLSLINDSYKKYGVKLLAVMPVAEYNIVLKEAVGDRQPSLKGMKIRTTPFTAPMVKDMGGAPVNLPPSELYTALQKGVIDGFTLVSVGLKDYKIYEVAKYLARPTFGYISLYLYINLDKYNALSVEERAWIDAAAIKTELDSKDFFHKKHVEEVAELKALGMEETQLRPEDGEKTDKAFRDSMIAVSKKRSGAEVEKIVQLATEQGLLK